MKIYWYENSKNIVGAKIKALRLENNFTQKELAAKLQLLGYDFNDLTILRIEQGKRFVADYELKALATVFHVTSDFLLSID